MKLEHGELLIKWETSEILSSPGPIIVAIGQWETIISFRRSSERAEHHRWHILQAQNRVSSFNTDDLITKIHPSWHILQAQNRVSSFNTDHLITKIHPKYGVQALALLVNQEIYLFLQVLLEGTISWLHLEAHFSKFEHYYSFDF